MSYLKSHMPCASNDKKTKANSSFMVSNLFHFLFYWFSLHLTYSHVAGIRLENVMASISLEKCQNHY